jgi:RNA polymerase sigma-70 factor, ECF subfamily
LVLDVSDLELARAAASGDAPAFHTLIDRHGREMMRLALLLSHNNADAEDICQEAWIGAFKGVKRFDGRSSFKTWLTRILLRQAAKTWKKKRRGRWISIDPPGPDAESEHDPTVPQPVARPANLDAAMDLIEVIRRLGPEHQQVVLLREVQGFSYEQIAQTLGIPCGTVESRLFRARAELRKHLKDYDI